ncbi:hypothetical protein GDO86_017939 [Hymenochirus boettgeri]|uniref:G-protein coupled receptors family 1 profile domain-containing protein n=1 Tax=Hymenochirus boettgeri TaxID=247094 RepID=A0A8T2IIY0_9PIPI|nr:hypothetical protein GDO86_017939 [Hymenochirus boettgeri]
MDKNQTSITEISILGFQNLHNFRIPLFTLFLLMYILTIYENVLIIALVSTSRNLQTPMYFFLQQLSISDLLVTGNVVPIMLLTLINEEAILSLAGCITQLYFFGSFETFQCLLLTIMSTDRYLAICKPLRYTSIMNHRVCVKLTSMSWASSFSTVAISINSIRQLQFCKQNSIDHFFCDLNPLLQLSCSDPSIIKSSAGRQKAFSTCSSHLAVVSIFFGALISIYVIPPRKQSGALTKVLSLLYTVLVPLINPMIYSLRNTDIKKAFKNMLAN